MPYPRHQARKIFCARVGQTSQSGHDRRAVHDRQPFLGPQFQWRDIQRRQSLRRRRRCAVAPDFPLAAQHGGKIRQRREIAAGPYRTLGWNPRQNIAAQQTHQLFEQCKADAGETFAQRRQPGRDHGAGLRGIEIFAQATTVEGIKLARQLSDQLRLNRHRAGITEARGHAIDRALFAEQAIEKVGAACDISTKLRRIGQTRASRALGDINDVLDPKPSLVEAN